MAIRIPVAALANFIIGSSVKQRSVLKNHKYPKTKDGQTRPPILHYTEAKAAIRRYHESGNDISVLLQAVESLSKKAVLAKTEVSSEGRKRDAARFDDNIRALNAYMQHFSTEKFVVLRTPKLIYKHGSVEVTAVLDLFVQDGSDYKLIKLDLSSKAPSDDAVEIILRVTAEAAIGAQLGLKPKNILYVDVQRKRVFNGGKLGKKLKKEIDAACEIIEDIWDRIKP